MHYIAHRINTIKELKNIPSSCGVEIDLRDYQDQIVVRHDPFGKGERFSDYLKNFDHAQIILNIKSERIEFDVLKLIRRYKIKNYFFLDSSFPMIVALTKLGERNIALRFSEFERLDTLEKMKGKVKWVWVDCFTKFPLTYKEFVCLKRWKFKLCLVSPELQGRERDIKKYQQIMRKLNIKFDAICTKIYNIPKWESQ